MASFATWKKVVATTVSAVAVLAALAAPITLASPASGTSSQILGHRATLSDSVQINEDRIKFQTKEPTDFQMQTITFLPGGYSGWHHHPGIIWVIVESGQITTYDEKCQAMKTVMAGQTFIESGHEAILVRNEGTTNATVYNAQVAPAGSPFRVEDDPPPCAG